ncbi:MAG: bleomycin resistance protein [Geminicoccaceae bacterium]
MKTIGLVPELYVRDIRRSLDFYMEILGFVILYQREEENFAYLKRENAELMLDQIGESRDWITGELNDPLGVGINFQIEVSNVSLLHQNLRTHKIEPFLKMEEAWYRKNDHYVGNKQFMVQDPDGYLLRFYQDLGRRNQPGSR